LKGINSNRDPVGGDNEVPPSNVSAPVGTSVTAADPITTLKVIEPTRDDAAGTVIVSGEVTLTLALGVVEKLDLAGDAHGSSSDALLKTARTQDGMRPPGGESVTRLGGLARRSRVCCCLKIVSELRSAPHAVLQGAPAREAMPQKSTSRQARGSR
jgi:hypothetical protein